MSATRIHPTAIVEPGVDLGDDTDVWDSVHIRSGARIGRRCIVGEKTYIAYGVRVGDGVKINAHVYVCTGVTIEDRVMIAAGVIFTNDRYPRAFDETGGLADSGPAAEALRTTVREGATIGAGACIGPGLVIGPYAMVGMGSVVVSDIPAHGLVFGNPARLRGFVCVCGLPLSTLHLQAGEAPHSESCTRCHRTYHTFNDKNAGLQLLLER